MGGILRLAEPTLPPGDIPVCRHHAGLVEQLVRLEAMTVRLDAKLDQVLEHLLPRDFDATLGGRVLALAGRVVGDPWCRRGLVLSVLVGAAGSSGYVLAGSLDGIEISPAGIETAADGVLPPVVVPGP